MRKMIIIALLFLVVGMILVLSFNQPEDVTSPQQRVDPKKYMVEREILIDESEAKVRPPSERWHYIEDLKYMTSIIVLCHPSSYEINDRNVIKEVADSFQKSTYLESTEYPTYEPDVKLYFKKNDEFIMAGRFYLKEGIIISPEGPIIKIDLETVDKIMNHADCL